MPKAIMTVGPSSSGKTTFAKDLQKQDTISNWVILERDQIRFELFTNCLRDWTKYKFNRKNEATVTEEYNKRLDILLSEGKNIIMCCTWLNSTYREEMIQKLTDEGYIVEIKSDWNDSKGDPITWETLRKRNEQRFGGIGTNILWSQYKKWWRYKNYFVYEPNLNLPTCVVFDIDGTLAIKHENRGHFDWSKVGMDYPRDEIVQMLLGYELNYHIVVASGRDASCRKETGEWLDGAIGSWTYDWLYMRPEGSFEKDWKVKLDMLKEISKEYNIIAWVDDRPQVSNFLRLIGVNVIQVSDPLKEF